MQLDLIVENAEIHTFDPARPRARRMGVLNGRIVGFDEDLRFVSARKTVDAGRQPVFPGFIDAHCHTSWFGLTLMEPSVSDCRTMTDLYEVIAHAVDGVDTSGDEWIVVNGFDQNLLQGNYPQRAVLDAVTGGIPLFLRHNSGHLAVVNGAALERAGAFSASYEDPAGGRVVRDQAGVPTGVVEETAQELFQQHFRPRSLAMLTEVLDKATSVYASQGITSFTDAGIGAGWIGQSPRELAAYQRVSESGSLHARAQLMPVLDALHPLEGHSDDGLGLGLDLGLRSGFGSDTLSIGPVKVFLDGSLLGRTAAVSEPYCGHHSVGYFQEDPARLRREITRAYAAGWSIAAHAIGDRAIDLALDLYESFARTFSPRHLPNRIEHASVVRPDQLERLKGLEVAVTPQSSFFEHGGDAMMHSLGAERSAWAYRVKSLRDAGVRVGGSSDRPVADGDPLRGMKAYVTRRTAAGAIFGNSAERVSVFEALALYTTGAAAACGIDDSRGSLAVGKLADATILSIDPLAVNSFDGVQVTATIMGGRLTYQR